MTRILYTTHFGSRLFGTSTPLSDTDIKHIELPSIQGLLVGHKIENRVVKTNEAPNTKNGVNDVDVEFIPLQRLARDFYEGQSYALEIAFSIDGSHAGQTHFDEDGNILPPGENSLFRDFIAELKANFLSSNINAMMGYVVNQANIYSFKGERLNIARDALAMLRTGDPNLTIGAMMMQGGSFAAEASRLAESCPKYFSLARYDIGGGRDAPCFKLLEKTLPWSVKVSLGIQTVAANVKKYGQRAHEASADNVDWKATMHAVRIVDEGLALLRDHQLTMPHSPEAAKRLLSIRRGELPLNSIRSELDEKIEILKNLSLTTSLPPISPELSARFDDWLQGWMMRFYGLSTAPEIRQACAGPK